MDEQNRSMRAAIDEPRAFRRIVEEHQPRILRFVTRMGVDRAAAEDIAQETFLRLWRARDAYDECGKLEHYLLRIARRICLDTLRADRPAVAIDDSAERPASERDATHIAVQARVLSEAVRCAVQTLPEEQREVFILSHYESLPYREIALVLDCPVGTVASRKRLAVEALRRRLASWEEPI